MENGIVPSAQSGSFSFTYLLYMCKRFSAVGASVFAWVFLHARDIARNPKHLWTKTKIGTEN